MIEVPDFLAYTFGIVVFFVGVHVNRTVPVLRNYNIPEPVTGGLIAALATFAIFGMSGREVVFELGTRDVLLVYFFTAIGINARLSDLVRGGRPLAVFLCLTLAYIVVQNVVGMCAAAAFGLPSELGVLVGSASLIGGHGTAIAWAPEIGSRGLEGALEIGVASATLGLVIASLIGGPLARFLISRDQLQSRESGDIVGLAFDDDDGSEINHLNLMSAILVIHIAILAGWFLHQGAGHIGFKLPLFVTCLLAGIVLSNTVPYLLRRVRWPARTPALALVSEFSLALFLSMSLMSMQLWTIAGLAGPLLGILLLQTVATVAFIMLVVYRAMGRDYQAAVLSAGFGGFALGATPTAIANMTAVTKANGPAPLAFLILPLVAAFFVDIANALIIRFAISL